MANRSESRARIATALLVARLQHDGWTQDDQDRIAKEAVALADSLLNALDRDGALPEVETGNYA